MSDHSDQVRAETERFAQALPRLLETHRGEWAVFKDGSVQQFYGSEDDAFTAAVDRFGPAGGFVVAPIVERRPIALSAAVAFGLR